MRLPAASLRLTALRVLLRTGEKFVKERPLMLVIVMVSQLPTIFVTPGYLFMNVGWCATTTSSRPAPSVTFDGNAKSMPPVIFQPERSTVAAPALSNSTYSSRTSCDEG